MSKHWAWVPPEDHTDTGRLCSAGSACQAFPDVLAPMQPSDSLPPSALAPVPLARAYLDVDACSVPQGPTTRAPTNVSCVGDDSPALRKTGIGRGEARASQVT